MSDVPTPNSPPSPQPEPQILRKDRSRDPVPDVNVGSGDNSAILDKTRDLGEDE